MPKKERRPGHRRSNPLFSIVTVVRNGADALERTIFSVADQDFDNYEYIILDGASTDGTLKVIERHSGQVSLWRSEPDKGVYDAMNKALSLCRGSYIYFLNCGDWFAGPGILSRASREVIATGADVVYGNVYDTWKADERIDVMRLGGTGDLLYKTICHQAMFASRRAFEIVGGFDTRYTICADREWLLRAALKHSLTLHHMDVPVSVFDNRDGLSSSERWRGLKRKENWRINARYFPLRAIGFFLRKTAAKLVSAGIEQPAGGSGNE